MSNLNEDKPLILSEEEVVKILTWESVFQAVEQALVSVLNNEDPDSPKSVLTARSFTSLPDKSMTLLLMPAYVENYKAMEDDTSKSKTLACKLLTKSKNNEKLNPPLPTLMSTICLFNPITGKLQGLIEGNNITEQRTAGASLVATKYLYFDRLTELSERKILSIVGCGAQGRIHTIGMLAYFSFDEIRLWNRTKSKAIELSDLLRTQINKISKNKNVQVIVCDVVRDCVQNADVICTGTFSNEPLIHFDMLKQDCHINAVGAGINHYSELDTDTYKNSTLYVSDWIGVEKELQGLQTNMGGLLGDVITSKVTVPNSGVTIFQSIGMGLYDATVAQFVYNKYVNSTK